MVVLPISCSFSLNILWLTPCGHSELSVLGPVSVGGQSSGVAPAKSWVLWAHPPQLSITSTRGSSLLPVGPSVFLGCCFLALFLSRQSVEMKGRCLSLHDKVTTHQQASSFQMFSLLHVICLADVPRALECQGALICRRCICETLVCVSEHPSGCCCDHGQCLGLCPFPLVFWDDWVTSWGAGRGR